MEWAIVVSPAIHASLAKRGRGILCAAVNKERMSAVGDSGACSWAGSSCMSKAGAWRARVDEAPRCQAPSGMMLFILAVLVAHVIWCRPALSQIANPDLWGVDGTVTSIARSGNTLYIGGSFANVGPNTGGGAPVSAVTGALLRPFPAVRGYVRAVVPDGVGGWYIAGYFWSVGGIPHHHIARILADGSVSPWDPQLDNPIETLAVKGDTVYAGGYFTTFAGESRKRLAAFNRTSGALTAWNPSADSWVNVVAVNDTTVYVGGCFQTVGEQARSFIAAVGAGTGAPTPWNAGANDEVWAIAPNGQTVYVGGYFTSVGGQTRDHVAELDAMTGAVTAWNPGATGPVSELDPRVCVNAFAPKGDTVFVGGEFTAIGGQARRSLAAVDATTGAALPWTPSLTGDWPGPHVSALILRGDGLFVGGWFKNASGLRRYNVVELSVQTAAPTDWASGANSQVVTLALSGEALYVGGTFTSVSEFKRRVNIAALDLTTGRVKDWIPNPDGLNVYALAVSGDRVYAGGDFTSVGGQPRSGIAALDTMTGAAMDWNPTADNAVEAIVVHGGTVYVGGGFGNIGGQARKFLAALDTTTGAATPWAPEANDYVLCLAAGGRELYAGGFFTWIGNHRRYYLAALDTATGAATEWDPGADSFVDALAIGGDLVYAGGGFTTIGGQPRNYLASIDAGTGDVQGWDPSPTGSLHSFYPLINALAATDSTLYVGGDFSIIGGQARNCIAALNGRSGAVLDWNPSADHTVWSVAIGGEMVYVGGMFGSIGEIPCSALAEIPVPRSPDRPPQSLTLAQNVPNPVRVNTTIRFALPTAAVVTLGVYDVQGRQVMLPLDHELRQPGHYDVPVRADLWRPGVYLYRLEAGGQNATRKMVVVR